MFPRLLFTALLEGLSPRSARVRRPVPIVWYDQIREPRALMHLRRLAVQWSATAAESPGVEHADVGLPACADARATVAASAGWAGVVFSRVRSG